MQLTNDITQIFETFRQVATLFVAALPVIALTFGTIQTLRKAS